jgi:arginine-tRNA-protein transferase
MSANVESFENFLYDSPLPTQDFCYRLGERLVGVSTVDRCPGGFSSVYMYFDPDEGKRSLGTYSVLREVEYSKTQGLPYYYLGYYVAGSKTMSYKARFRPNEILVQAGRWAAPAE